MSIESVPAKSQYISELRDKDKIASVFLIKFSAVSVDKNGKPYMNLVLMDRSGEIDARIWSEVSDLAGLAVRDAFVWVEGKVQTYQGRRQVVVKDIDVLREDEINPKDFRHQSDVDADDLYAKLKAIIQTMNDPFYRALAESVLVDDKDAVERLKKAPAAKSVHHAYPSGLLEHMISISETLEFLASHYIDTGIDRDLLLLGGFFHDIGKLWELSYDFTTDYTDEGKLIGHHVIGVELITKKILELESTIGTPEAKIPAEFPKEKELLIKHVVLAHHGKLEYGSPKRPKCLEAFIVHQIDDMDSKINAISDFIKKDMGPGKWTNLNRHYDRFFYKGDRGIQN